MSTKHTEVHGNSMVVTDTVQAIEVELLAQTTYGIKYVGFIFFIQITKYNTQESNQLVL
jgi:hypothetical protein